MKNNKNYHQNKVPEKKLWMRIAVLALCAVILLGIVILPLVS